MPMMTKKEVEDQVVKMVLQEVKMVEIMSLHPIWALALVLTTVEGEQLTQQIPGMYM